MIRSEIPLSLPSSHPCQRPPRERGGRHRGQGSPVREEQEEAECDYQSVITEAQLCLSSSSSSSGWEARSPKDVVTGRKHRRKAVDGEENLGGGGKPR